MTNMEIEWADPPSPRADPFYDEFAQALRDHPGRWAKWPKVYKNASSVAAIRKNIADGDRRAPVPFRTDGWEAVVRQGVLYVRYVGDKE